MDIVEILIGVTEIAVALAGFTGVVVAFGSRAKGSWHPGDRLRLTFLLEASLTAAGFALLGVLLISLGVTTTYGWSICSITWSLYMMFSLTRSRRSIKDNDVTHGDVDRIANTVTVSLFLIMIAVQIFNALLWQQFAPFLGALLLNLVGAAMQFTRLIRSAFQS